MPRAEYKRRSRSKEAELQDIQRARDGAQEIVDNIKRVIIGKDEAVELAVIGLLCHGHLLIEDVPGVGKTMLARSLALSAGCTFRRIQFTPDLLPSDITGVSIYNQKTGDFEFRPGPISAEIVLADEITPDGCRLWDKATRKKLDKDRFRRDLGGIEEAYAEIERRVAG